MTNLQTIRARAEDHAGGADKLEERLSEAAKHGFTRAIVPRGNAPKGTLKGMLWQGGGAISPLFTDFDHLENLISNLRTDLRKLELPVVVGETPGKASHNTQLKALTQDVHASALAEEGAGAAFAKAMVKLEKEWPDDRPTPAPRVAVIDPLAENYMDGLRDAAAAIAEALR